MSKRAIEIAIVSLVSFVMSMRGLVAMISREYHSTGKYGAVTNLYGEQAVYAGAMWLCLAGFVLSSLLYRTANGRVRFFVVGAGFVALAAYCDYKAF